MHVNFTRVVLPKIIKFTVKLRQANACWATIKKHSQFRDQLTTDAEKGAN